MTLITSKQWPVNVGSRWQKSSSEGVIIEWPPNGLFHDARDVILTSQMAVREMVVNVGNVGNAILGKITSR